MSIYLKFLGEANKRQYEAIVERKGHCVVLAGPGTGKTRTLVLKAAKLLYEEVFPPQGIACVTYAHAMAKELQEKLRELGISPKPNVFMGTLHGFCLVHIILPFDKLYSDSLPDHFRIGSASDQAKLYYSVWSNYSEKNKIPEFKPKSKLASELPEPFQKYRCTHLDGLHAPNVNLYVENLPLNDNYKWT